MVPKWAAARSLYTTNETLFPFLLEIQPVPNPSCLSLVAESVELMGGMLGCGPHLSQKSLGKPP